MRAPSIPGPSRAEVQAREAAQADNIRQIQSLTDQRTRIFQRLSGGSRSILTGNIQTGASIFR